MQSVAEFIENEYLPFVRERLRVSTSKGYQEIFKNHLKSRLSGIRLRDFRTVDGERLLGIIAQNSPLTHRTLLHIKSFLSGIFTCARRLGVIEIPNPMRDVSVPRGLASAQTLAYSLEEVQTMIRLLPEPHRTLVAVAAFTGLRASEICGLQWDDFTGDEIKVSRTVWRKTINDPKTHASAAAVPVLTFLCKTLAEHRKKNGGKYIFETANRNPIDLHTFGSKVIRPALDGSGVEWKGWHPFRRGLATNLHRLGVPPRTIQAILRHSNVSTTLSFYVKTSSADAYAAMQRLEKEMGNDWATAVGSKYQ
jgi:integrase